MTTKIQNEKIDTVNETQADKITLSDFATLHDFQIADLSEEEKTVLAKEGHEKLADMVNAKKKTLPYIVLRNIVPLIFGEKLKMIDSGEKSPLSGEDVTDARIRLTREFVSKITQQEIGAVSSELERLLISVNAMMIATGYNTKKTKNTGCQVAPDFLGIGKSKEARLAIAAQL